MSDDSNDNIDPATYVADPGSDRDDQNNDGRNAPAPVGGDVSRIIPVPQPRQSYIYKIPRGMGQRKPEAYTPQKVLIGPLNNEVLDCAERAGTSRPFDNNHGNPHVAEYLSTAEQKLGYQAAFGEKVGKSVLRKFKETVLEDEKRIRESYSESTAWIGQEQFVDMIYGDSVFILEFMLRTLPGAPQVPGDPLTMPLYRDAIKKDLMLLENQLPFYILEDLFIATRHRLGRGEENFRKFVIFYFGGSKKQLEGEIKHFTDLLRRIYVDTLDPEHLGANLVLEPIYNAEKLKRGRVKLVAGIQEPSLVVRYGNGRLEIPRFTVDETSELKLRNIMALELWHYPDKPYVCNHVMFLDYLIDTERDVEALAEKGILRRSADSAVIAMTVNNLNPGATNSASYLASIARDVNDYCNTQEEKYNHLLPILKRTYFSNLWSGTATIIAAVIVLCTVGAFIVAIIDLIKK